MLVSKISANWSPSLNKDNTGLGNVLFQIFTAYGLSKKYNYIFNNTDLNNLLVKLEKWNLNHKLTIYRNLITKSVDFNNFIKLSETNGMYSLYDNNITNIISKFPNMNYCIFGYFQSHLYFDEYRSEIIKLIQPDNNSLNYIKTNYSHLFDKDVVNISLHIRNKWGFNITYNMNFFYEAINYIKKNINSTNIIINVFSDDILNIEKKFNYTGNKIIFFKNNFDYIDLWCMSLCDHNILSHSTLSWWGAYINETPNKLVIYSKDLLRLDNARIYPNIVKIDRQKEHYKKEWISLDISNTFFQ